jgi:hypothetical protein
MQTHALHLTATASGAFDASIIAMHTTSRRSPIAMFSVGLTSLRRATIQRRLRLRAT